VVLLERIDMSSERCRPNRRCKIAERGAYIESNDGIELDAKETNRKKGRTLRDTSRKKKSSTRKEKLS